MLNKELNLAIEAAQLAGESILTQYKTNNEVVAKSDGSPVTVADKLSHKIIVKTLKASGLPIVSEEDINQNQASNQYWLVDPLDGTKDYLAKNDEFTVNIALIREEFPILGIVYAPALNEMFIGLNCQEAWHIKNNKKTLCLKKDRNVLTNVTTSRFHDDPDLEIFMSENNVGQIVSAGSALKFGRVATCEADVYPRVVGTSEWDTAAGQAVVEGAGGHVIEWETGSRLRYGRTNRRNPRFICFRSPYKYSDFKLKKYKEEVK